MRFAFKSPRRRSVVSDLNQAVPDHLADEGQIRWSDTQPDHPCGVPWTQPKNKFNTPNTTCVRSVSPQCGHLGRWSAVRGEEASWFVSAVSAADVGKSTFSSRRSLHSDIFWQANVAPGLRRCLFSTEDVHSLVQRQVLFRKKVMTGLIVPHPNNDSVSEDLVCCRPQ